MGLVGELLNSLNENGEGMDTQAIAEKFSKASPAMQHEALLVQIGVSPFVFPEREIVGIISK